MQTSKLCDKLNHKKQIESLSHIYCAMFQNCHAISTAKIMMKKHEHEQNCSESITSSHIYSSHHFRSNRAIYELSNKVYKATHKKHNAAC